MTDKEQTSVEAQDPEYNDLDRPLLRTTFRLGIFVMIVFLVMLLVSLARAGASDCEFIKNADDRHFCRATAKNLKSECEFIRDNDKRHACRARFSPR